MVNLRQQALGMKASSKFEHAGTTSSNHPQGCENVDLPCFIVLWFCEI